MDYSRARNPIQVTLLVPISLPRVRGRVSVGARGSIPSASPRTFVRELALGLVAAFVDAFQAFCDHGQQFLDPVLLLGVFRIHQLCCYDVSDDATDDGPRVSVCLTASL